jgi:hypothetical protein
VAASVERPLTASLGNTVTFYTGLSEVIVEATVQAVASMLATGMDIDRNMAPDAGPVIVLSTAATVTRPLAASEVVATALAVGLEVVRSFAAGLTGSGTIAATAAVDRNLGPSLACAGVPACADAVERACAMALNEAADLTVDLDVQSAVSEQDFAADLDVAAVIGVGLSVDRNLEMELEPVGQLATAVASYPTLENPWNVGGGAVGWSVKESADGTAWHPEGGDAAWTVGH